MALLQETLQFPECLLISISRMMPTKVSHSHYPPSKSLSKIIFCGFEACQKLVQLDEPPPMTRNIAIISEIRLDKSTPQFKVVSDDLSKYSKGLFPSHCF